MQTTTVTIALLALQWLLSMASVEAAETQSEPTTAAGKCSAHLAEHASVREVAQNPAQFEGRCVAIGGVMRGWYLYDDVDGVYLEPKDATDPSSNGALLGLDNLGNRYSEAFRHVTIIGRVQNCESVRASVQASAGPGEVAFVSGYCHYQNGAYLWVERVRSRAGKPWERRMGSAGRPGFGDLQSAADGWPHTARVESLADAFLAALRAGDRDALAAMHFGNVEESEDPDVLDFLLKNKKSPFASIRLTSNPIQRALFVERPRLYGTEADLDDGRDDDNYTATVCFCREADCTGRWPIASIDADNAHARPYACTRIEPYVLSRKGTVPHFSTELPNGGLAEPKHEP